MVKSEYKRLEEDANILQRNASDKCNFETHKVQSFYNGYQQGIEDLLKCVRQASRESESE